MIWPEYSKSDSYFESLKFGKKGGDKIFFARKGGVGLKGAIA